MSETLLVYLYMCLFKVVSTVNVLVPIQSSIHCKCTRAYLK